MFINNKYKVYLRNSHIPHIIDKPFAQSGIIFQAEFNKAQHDIEEAMTIAERGEMGLHQADCHLEYARLYLAMRDEARTREHLANAIKMIKQMGYHRRDNEVKELEAML